MSLITEDCMVIHANRTIKDGMGGYVVIRADTVKKYNKSEQKLEEISEISQEEK